MLFETQRRERMYLGSKIRVPRFYHKTRPAFVPYLTNAELSAVSQLLRKDLQSPWEVEHGLEVPFLLGSRHLKPSTGFLYYGPFMPGKPTLQDPASQSLASLHFAATGPLNESVRSEGFGHL